VTRPFDEQRLDESADAQFLQIALGALSLARRVEALARERAGPDAAADPAGAEEPALLACLGLLSLSRTLEQLLPAASSAPTAPAAGPATADPRGIGLLR
jgi:hypothetical protein